MRRFGGFFNTHRLGLRFNLKTRIIALILATNKPGRFFFMIIMHTNFGDITLELDEKKAPKTVANFLAYANEGFFDGTIFHRVIDNFMIQGGGMDENMQQKPTKDPVENEADNGLKNVTGSIAMARTMDPHSATAQFFINVKDNDFLNFKAKNSQGWGYTVFGKVTDGMTVVNKIKGVKTATRAGHQDVPVEAVIIQSVEVVESAPATDA